MKDLTKQYSAEQIALAEAWVRNECGPMSEEGFAKAVEQLLEQRSNPVEVKLEGELPLQIYGSDKPFPQKELSPLQKLMGPDFRVLEPGMQARLQHVMDTTPIMDVEADGIISSFLPLSLDPEKVAELTQACDELTGGEFSRKLALDGKNVDFADIAPSDLELLGIPSLTFEEKVTHRLKMAWINDQISLKFDGGEADLETVRKYLRQNASYYPYETRDQWYQATGGVTSNPNGGLDFEYPDSGGICMSDINPPKPTDAQVEHLLAQLAKANAAFKGQ